MIMFKKLLTKHYYIIIAIVVAYIFLYCVLTTGISALYSIDFFKHNFSLDYKKKYWLMVYDIEFSNLCKSDKHFCKEHLLIQSKNKTAVLFLEHHSDWFFIKSSSNSLFSSAKIAATISYSDYLESQYLLNRLERHRLEQELCTAYKILNKEIPYWSGLILLFITLFSMSFVQTTFAQIYQKLDLHHLLLDSAIEQGDKIIYMEYTIIVINQSLAAITAENLLILQRLAELALIKS